VGKTGKGKKRKARKTNATGRSRNNKRKKLSRGIHTDEMPGFGGMRGRLLETRKRERKKRQETKNLNNRGRGETTPVRKTTESWGVKRQRNKKRGAEQS